MIRNLIWLNGVSTEEKFVKEFMSKIEGESIKVSSENSVPLWDKHHVREQALLGVISGSFFFFFLFVLFALLAFFTLIAIFRCQLEATSSMCYNSKVN